jgi:hypothetical protein
MLQDESLSNLNNISGMMVDSPNIPNENNDVESVVNKSMEGTQDIEEPWSKNTAVYGEVTTKNTVIRNHRAGRIFVKMKEKIVLIKSII